jgi:carbonic anhydrase
MYIFIQFLFFFLLRSINCQYDYQNEPASEWKGICKSGFAQSPINFYENFTSYSTNSIMKIVSANYGIENLVNTTLRIFNTVKYMGVGTNQGFIEVMKFGTTYRYYLESFHFKISSEHKFNGDSGEVELQIVHRKNLTFLTGVVDNDPKYDILTIAVLFKVASNLDNPNINKLNIQNRGPAINFNLGIYPPIGRPFFFYEGSLTDPPCEERVNWVVVQTMETISKSQYEVISEWISTTYLGRHNNRDVKNINNRKLYYQYYPEQTVITDGSKSQRLKLIGYSLILFILLLF